MANNKKSVLLYCDIIHTVEKLDDADAGILFKHYLRYINDQNPEPPSKLIDIIFEPIKQNLKRDLKKWESKSERNSAIAKEMWIKRNDANAYEREKDDAKDADKVIVTVKDKVIVKDINTKYWARPCIFLQQNEIEFEELHMKLGITDFQECLEQWSLSIEGSDFAYSDNQHEDYRKLKARFQKWCNSWRQNKTEKNKPKPEKIPESVRLGKAKLVEVNGQMLVKPLDWKP